MAQELRQGKYFLIHKGFILKRLQRLSSYSFSEKVRKAPMAILGFIFDLALYLWANHLMRKGAGAGYW